MVLTNKKRGVVFKKNAPLFVFISVNLVV